MRDGRVIGLISGKGGVGKTSLCVNLGAALNDFGAEVTLVDADFSASNLGVYLGRYDHPVKMQHVLEGRSEPENAIFRHPSGLKAAVSANEVELVEPDLERLDEVLAEAASESDYVLVDCPPGMDTTVEQIMMACDELLIATMPTQTAGVNAAQVIEKAKKLRKPVLGTVINKVEDDPEMELVDREIEMMTESHTVSRIPYDVEMKRSLFEGELLVDYSPISPAAIEIKSLAAEIHGVEYEAPKFAGLKRKLDSVTGSMIDIGQ